MDEIGIDLSEHRAKGVDEYLGHIHFGYLITVCDHAAANCPTFLGVSTRLHWPTEDPAAVEGTAQERLAVFRRVRDELAGRVQAFVAEN